MKRVLNKYVAKHQKALLCEIGAFRDILAFHGCELSLPMTFGISAAIGFGYNSGKSLRPVSPDLQLSYAFITPFSPNPLMTAGLITGMWRRFGRCSDSLQLENTIKASINEGNPIIVEVESVAYFKLMKMAFPSPRADGETQRLGGHVVVVCGYDSDSGTLTIQESMLRDPVEVKIAEFLAVCNVFGCDIPPENEWSVFYPPSSFPPIKEMILDGLKLSSQRMSHPLVLNPEITFGIDGLNAFSSRFLHDLQNSTPSCQRKTLSLILNFGEMMAPRSGFLRSVFIDFISEAARFWPQPNWDDTIRTYVQAKELWIKFLHECSLTIKEGGHLLDPSNTEEITELLNRINNAEICAAGSLEDLVKEIES